MYLAANKNISMNIWRIPIDIWNNYSCMNIDKKFYVGSVNEFYL